jgi:WD repeat and FYVE domain-containing protein 3
MKMVKSNQVFKDVFRELGLLEIVVSCLHKFAATLKENYTDINNGIKQNNLF